jgi:hypothetical protein
MKTILHKLRNGGVGSYPPSPVVVAEMMGPGAQWPVEQIAREIAKMMTPVSDEAAAAGKVTYTETMATEWVLALSDGGLTEAEALDLFTRRIQERNGYTDNAVVEYETLPYHIRGNGNQRHGSCPDLNCHDRYFRDAMVFDVSQPEKCRCDMDKARGIHLGHIRHSRDAELAKLDVPFMQALEASDTTEKTRIATLKQTLRDIPQKYDLSVFKTPEELKAAWPKELDKIDERIKDVKKGL